LDDEGDHLISLGVAFLDSLAHDLLVLEVLNDVVHDQQSLFEVLLV
jgi:hypothetical protein